MLQEGEFPLTNKRVRRAAVQIAFGSVFCENPDAFKESWLHAQRMYRADTNEHAAVQLKSAVQRVQIVAEFLTGNVYTSMFALPLVGLLCAAVRCCARARSPGVIAA